MREEDEVVRKLSAHDIQNLGFDWPKYALIEKYCVIEGGKVDLTRTIERMQSSRAYYKGQLDQALLLASYRMTNLSAISASILHTG